MPSGWKKVVRLTFKGKRFEDHALDLTALTELSQFQRLVAETAKTLWRAQNPDRERLPKNFEQTTRLCLRTIEEGSAVAPLEVFIEDGEADGRVQDDIAEGIWHEEPPELVEAIDLANEVYRALEEDRPLPERFPRSLLPEYQKWGKTLGEDEEIEIDQEKKPTSRTSLRQIERFSKFVDLPHETPLELSGEVFEADVRNKRFQVLQENGTAVTVQFNEEQESEVTTALKDHKVVRIHLSGMGKVTADGTAIKVREVDKMKLHKVDEIPYDETARPIGEILEEIAKEVPEEEWEKLPTDLSLNLDHYLYGAPKR